MFSFLLVAAAGVTLYFYVDVTSRFEDRLWKLPSRIYSDRLVVRPGTNLDLNAVTARLDRSGYARASGPPARPGQYRVHRGALEIRARAFEGSSPPPDGVVRIRFSGDRVRSLRRQDGRAVRALQLEPELLATMSGPRQEERHVVALADVPQELIHAVLAAEDARFYDHRGVDLRAVGRAAWANVRSGGIVQGGSTITQQTVKNLFLGPERTWWRKGREAVMSILLDLRYRKDRILEVYLNEVYLGQRGSVAICGVEAASRFYFGRGIADLSVGESALVAGMIRSPGRYNPFVNGERARARRDQVLDAMVRLELLTPAAADRARGEELRLASGGGGFREAPYVVDFVRSQLEEHYPSRLLLEEGLRVYTTIDTAIQAQAEQVLRDGLERLERDAPMVRQQKRERTLQGAAVVLEPGSGAVLAMVGGRDYESSQFNRAVQARRQPGSCFKPFVYLAGFEEAIAGERNGLTAATVLDDEPFELVSGGEPWRPENYDGTFRGPVTARRALEESLNVPTVRAAQRVGLDRIVDTASRAGITSPLRALPSLALGTIEVTPLELAAAYATLAQQGSRARPTIIREVLDRDGNSIERRHVEMSQSVDPLAAYLTTHVLEGVFERGTARTASGLGFHGRAAGKTGTTDDTRDAWFVGYTPDVLALVWVGYDDNARTGLTGASGALPIWVDLMRGLGLEDSRRRFATPPGIVGMRIDPESGGVAVEGCPRRTVELFAAGTEPNERCPLHRAGLKRWFRDLFKRKRDRDRSI